VDIPVKLGTLIEIGVVTREKLSRQPWREDVMDKEVNDEDGDDFVAVIC
jgi:hypothetical protein